MQMSERLLDAISRKGISQAKLAEHLEVSGAAVSSWCSGSKSPALENLEAMAKFLGVTPGYLQFGEGAGPEPDSDLLDQARQSYQDQLEWYWRPGPRDGGRDMGNAAAYAFDTDINSLARESGQNISDEKLAGEPTVIARYTVSELSGPTLNDFLETIKFDEVRPHLESATRVNRKAASVITRGLTELDGGPSSNRPRSPLG